VDIYPEPRTRPVRLLRPERIARLLGSSPEAARVREVLDALGLEPKKCGDSAIETTVPSWRVDLAREEDLVEEVARHIGYDTIPVTLAGLPHPAPAAPAENAEESARSVLSALGFQEAIGYAMIGDGADVGFVPEDGAPAPRLANPIADALACLRRSLLPGLLQAVDTNHRRGTPDVHVFEVGRVFRASPAGGRPDERRMAAFAWSGAARPAHWSEPSRAVGYPDVAGVVERLLSGLRPGHGATATPGAPGAFHPGRSATWRVAEGPILARAGALHPERQRGFDHALWIAEVDLDAVAALPRAPARFVPLPRLSPVTRDLSLEVSRTRAFGDIAAVLRAVPAPAAAVLDVLDRYEGPPLRADQVAITVRVTLTPDEQTLLEAEIEAYRLELVRAIGGLAGVRLRGE
jgi:phenylalanyl-tRNA synthetase beta chain